MTFSLRDRMIHKGLNVVNDLLNKSVAERIISRDGSIRLCWAATTESKPYANIGDALSAIVVSALSGRICRAEGYDSPRERLFAVGTIAHGAREGIAHIWGSGLDPSRNITNPSIGYYTAPPRTRLHVHATRGPDTRRALQRANIEAPEIYGDPVWILPSIIPAAEKRWELGVIVHITELDSYSPSAKTLPEFLRYMIPNAFRDRVKIINTLTEPNLDAIIERVDEITSCRRILSTSLHGLVYAESYGIPCQYFGYHGNNVAQTVKLAETPSLDHRVRDLYSGVGQREITLYGCERSLPTDWEAAMQSVDQNWTSVDFDAGPLLDAFPLPKTFDPRNGKPFEDFDLLRQIKF